ncbi:DUF971 domain-containing protein [Oxalobacteraceae bacterium]|nr:DUF971 domain-containing protein [Oxalobacteraceae bacterium]
MQPLQINNDKAAGWLTIEWADGRSQRLRHAGLRALCKCTLCQSQRLRGAADAAASCASAQQDGVRVVELHLVGAYGLQLVFSDGHEKGIYPWVYLRLQGGFGVDETSQSLAGTATPV